jgi:hypothetical protein
LLRSNGYSTAKGQIMIGPKRNHRPGHYRGALRTWAMIGCASVAILASLGFALPASAAPSSEGPHGHVQPHIYEGHQSYWLAASDGGIFSYGQDALFYGSEGGAHLDKPIVGIASNPYGGGYWEGWVLGGCLRRRDLLLR